MNQKGKNTIKIHEEIVNNLISIEDIENYCNYMIAEYYLCERSGLFTIDEFINVLVTQKGFKYDSLKCKSNQNKFKKVLFKKFKKSTLFFQHIEKETFKIISYRKILNQLGSSKYINKYYYFPLNSEANYKDFGLYKKTFMDYVIGTYVLTHNGFSNKQVAKHFSITPARVQLATRKNNEKDFIKKIFRLAQTPCEDKKHAMEVQHKLWDIGIRSTIKEKKKTYYVCTYRTNNYDANLPSHNSRVKKKAEATSIQKRYSKQIDKSSILFKLLNGRKLKINIPLSKTNYLYFNYYDKNWNLDNYAQEYGTIFA